MSRTQGSLDPAPPARLARASPADRGGVRQPRLTLRITLLSLVLGLLLVTVTMLAGINYVSQTRSLEDLEARYFALAPETLDAKLQALLQPAAPALNEAVYLASEELHAAAGPGFEWRRLDRVVVVGRRAPTPVYELLGEVGTVADDVLRARDYCEAALAAYFARRFEAALAGFQAAAALVPTDRAAPLIAQRAEYLHIYQPGPAWDGAYVATTK